MGRKFTIFALFYFVFEGKFQVQAARGAYIRRGDLTEGFFALRFWGAKIWRGLYMEGLIFGILRYCAGIGLQKLIKEHVNIFSTHIIFCDYSIRINWFFPKYVNIIFL